MATKIINVAKGKVVNTTLDFANIFSGLNVEQKTAVLKNLNTALETGLTPSGIKAKETELTALRQPCAWCMTNILIGNELCPHSSLKNY